MAAMSMPGTRPHYQLKSIQRRHLEELAKRIGVSAQAEALIGEIVEKTPAVIEQVQRGLPKGFPQPTLERTLEGMRNLASAL